MAKGASPSGQTPYGDFKLEKNAGLIMGTNNSSIVSKRSVERLYLPQPHFYRYFVRKPQRRSPIINRGYWLRMRAVEHTVRKFLEKPSEKQKVILNLGCGYDPLPFQWLAAERQLCNSVKFIDVDYEELMISKSKIISSTTELKSLLRINPSASQSEGILFDSEEYAGLGCDLRNLRLLETLVKGVVPVQDCEVLCIAEVSIVYMHPDAADALISWTTTLSEDVTFCLIEQRSPDRADNPFTSTMMQHFEKLGTPLRSVFKYPGSHTQSQRFFAAGFTNVEAQSLWEFWSNLNFLTPSQRLALDHVEPFDEWEEFALFASHYSYVVASTGSFSLKPGLNSTTRPRRDSCASLDSQLSTRTVSPFREGSQFFAYRYCKVPEGEARTHHASAYPIPNSDALGIHGGIGRQTRLSTTSVYGPLNNNTPFPTIPPTELQARSCHTITALENGQNILIGGRASPTNPLKDCWLQTGATWKRVQDLPAPRFRHRTVSVALPNNKFGVIVFGGKSGPITVHVDALIWSEATGWQALRSLRDDPVPRFGAMFVSLGNNHGLLFGGMRQDGVICQGFWRWRLVIRDCIVAGIAFRESTALDASVGTLPWLARMGGSYSLIRNELLIIGGIAKQGCIPNIYEVLSVSGSFSALGEFEQEMDMRINCVVPALCPDQPRPFLIGHCSHRTRRDQTLIMGGGATCFSFGSYWNKGVWLLHDTEAGLSTDWTLLKPPTLATSESNATVLADNSKLVESSTFSVPTDRVRLQNERDFENIVSTSTPKIIESLDLGPCTTAWTTAYLRSKIPSDRSVVVHRANSRNMNFQRKDFVYTSVPFHAFLDAAQAGHHLYLRSLSTKAPTNTPTILASDYPEIASDFQIPSELKLLNDPSHFHSSPLRISSNLNMWLHYDVMANVLFQIRGNKKLLLFPPKDIPSLKYPAGATTSLLDVFSDSPADATEIYTKAPPGTSPTHVILRPGDALFIPPMWSHAGSPFETSQSPKSNPMSPIPRSSSTDTREETATARATTNSISNPATKQGSTQNSQTSPDPVNISINIFFRSFAPRTYAAGRDVYGNRDLAAYEDGRRDVERMVRRFLISNSSNNNTNNSSTLSINSDNQTQGNPLEDANTNTNGAEEKTKSTSLPSPPPSSSMMEPESNIPKHIPREIAKVYLQRLAAELLARAEQL